MLEKSTKFKDKVILITDIGSEAGLHTAVFCAEKGASLVLNCPNKTDPYLIKNTFHKQSSFIYKF